MATATATLASSFALMAPATPYKSAVRNVVHAAPSSVLRGQALRIRAPVKVCRKLPTGVVASSGPFGDISSVTPLLPRLLPAIARAGVLVVGFWASMNWVFYRKLRKQGQKYLEMTKAKEEERQEKLRKLQPEQKKGNDQ
jgi:hypothetical protein